jgi:iron complex outermembrane receptor protein
MRDDIDNGLFVLDPAMRTMQLYSGFAQDQIALVPRRLKLTIGTKLEHNVFSGFEVQPNARLAWSPDSHQTVWAAVSRAVRSPSRADVDFRFPLAGLSGSPAFKAEEVIAYELGYRTLPTDRVSLSLSTFVNDYGDLRSTNRKSPPPGLLYANDLAGWTWGVEFAANLEPATWWRLRAGYIHLHVDLSTDNPATVTVPTGEANDPADQVVLHSILDLPAHLQVDAVARYVSALPAPTPRVDDYYSLDVRLGWQWRHVELAVVGQNLVNEHHSEFGVQTIPRGLFGKAAIRW